MAKYHFCARYQCNARGMRDGETSARSIVSVMSKKPTIVVGGMGTAAQREGIDFGARTTARFVLAFDSMRLQHEVLLFHPD